MGKYIVVIKETIYSQTEVCDTCMANIASDVMDNYADYEWQEITETSTEVVSIREENSMGDV